MSLAQLHYTPAPAGPDGPGCARTAVTPGTPPSVLREAVALLGYEPPQGTPADLCDERLRALPKALSCTALSDGGRLLARVVPTGSGQGDPAGAFHAHAVYLPPGTPLPGGAPPIAAWGAPEWRTQAPEEAPPPLAGFSPSAVLDRAGLTAFALARSAALPAFFAALRRVTRGPGGGDGGASGLAGAGPQLVVVEDDPVHVARWTALAAAVLPRAWAHALTFTTYTRHPRLAPQEILGVRPEDSSAVLGDAEHYLVLDASRPGAAGGPGEDDVWARTAAAVWRRGLPEVFARAEALSPQPFDAGALAVVAAEAGVELDSPARAAAAHLLCERPAAVGGDRWEALLAALCPAGERLAGTPVEAAARARLLGVLTDPLPAAVLAPLTAAVLTDAVHEGGPAVPALRPGALPEPLRRSLAAGLAGPLRRQLAEAELPRALGLLHLAQSLEVDCAAVLPGVADRLAQALLCAEEGTATPEAAGVLRDSRWLRMPVLDALEERAVADPGAVAALLRRLPLDLDTERALPHLRMCAAVAAPGGPGPGVTDPDRTEALRSVLRASGTSLFAAPEVLPTALALVWEGGLPSAAAARLLVKETGSDVHRAAGTWRTLVATALHAPADDWAAPELAADLLRCFLDLLTPPTRAALSLRAYAGDLGSGRAAADEDWSARVQTLRAEAGEVPAVVVEQAGAALAGRLLRADRPEGQLYSLAATGDEALLAAYHQAVDCADGRERLRTGAAFAADCFVAWHSCEGASQAWERTRAALLDQVLRPAVRARSPQEVLALEEELARVAERWAERFRAWNRPGAFGRLVRRWGGR
ncbi:GTPase-associated protein 1-related protein [Streptomyces sp. NPDC059740]|uniref:GTPase-associated protein 1-related protein n=1 Tax=Streptomyces sp. NPDC059740 TaxID=3346926 RepID=UPI003650C91A